MKRSTVYVWHARLNEVPSAQNEYLWSLLAHDEKARANRFHSENHRRRFIIARGLLRRLAGYMLNQAPRTLQFNYTSYGKPVFKDYPRTHFNLSHSHDRAIYAFTLDAPVGVDIEYQNPQCYPERIARRFFTRREHAALQKLQEAEKIALFFKLWAGKEAVLKALGTGLSARALAEVEFDLTKQSVFGQALSADHHHRLKAAEWSLYTFNPAQDFVAALALQAHPQYIEVQSMDEPLRFY